LNDKLGKGKVIDVLLTPANRDELAAALRAAAHDRVSLQSASLDLGRLNRVCRYAPEDLTVTAEAGLTLRGLQTELGRHGQWLPVDPPGADDLSLATILDHDLSGPRRQGHGTIREHLIGLRVALADGRIIRSGGEVVKNVAGYDLMKLFVGARGSLGVIVEAAFKLLPRPASESFLRWSGRSWEHLAEMFEAVQESPITPVVFDAHRLSPTDRDAAVASVVLGFAGTAAEVAWQLSEVNALGPLGPTGEPTTLDYAAQFARENSRAMVKESVLPSRLVETLRLVSPAPFVARAGLGVLYHRGSPVTSPPPVPSLWLRRVKETFDPSGLFPEAPGL
jgi:FAD/FMN-containing dehydrogenase